MKFNIDNNTGTQSYKLYLAVSCRGQERNVLGVYAEMPDLFTVTLRGEDQRGEDHSLLRWKGNAAWLQLYAFLCAQTGCLFTGRLPGAKAINALIQAEKNPDNAPGQLNRIVE